MRLKTCRYRCAGRFFYILTMIYLLSFIALFFIAFTAVGMFLSGPRYRGPVTDHFDGKTFFTPGGAKAKGLPDVLKWMIQRKQAEWKPQMDLPVGEKPIDTWSQGVRITFVNHSTFLLQLNGLNVLTDPVWSERTSPFSFAGPKRMRPAGIHFQDLPHVHLVLLSHNHYDHLDIDTVKKIAAKWNPLFVVPLGVGLFLQQHGISNFRELDWWGETSIAEKFVVQSVPAQHFSGRGTLDRDATLWCGYVIKREGGNIYFAADSGYNNKIFKEIGERCSPQLSIIPIGAYKPEWFMSPIHCSPEEAVQIHLDLNSPQSIATHYGTFPLADDGYADPLSDLTTALHARGVTSEKFLALKEGEARVFLS